MIRSRIATSSLLVLAAAACLLPSTVSAETSTYYLSTFNITPTPGNYARIVVTGVDSDSIDFDITTDWIAGANTVEADDEAELAKVGFSVKSAFDGKVSISSVDPSYAALGTNHTLDGYGKFDYYVGFNPDSSSRVETMSFTIDITGATWDGLLSSFFDVSSKGKLFAAEYFPSIGATGFIDGAGPEFIPPPPPVPEPSALALAGFGICSFLGFGKFRRRKA